MAATGLPYQSLQWVSLAVSILLLIATYQFGTHLFGEVHGRLATLLVALSPFAVVHSTWMRMYTLFPLFVILAWATACAFVRKPTRRVSIAHAAVTVATGVLHPFAVFHTAGVTIYLSVQAARRSGRGYYLVALNLGVGTCIAAWLIAKRMLPSSAGSINQLNHVPPLNPINPLAAPAALLLGTIFSTIGLVAAFILTASLLVHVWRYRDDARTQLLGLWVFVPLTGAAVASLVHPVFSIKYVGFTLPGVALLVLDSRRSIGQRPHQVLVGALIVVLAVHYGIAFTDGVPLHEVATRVQIGSP